MKKDQSKILHHYLHTALWTEELDKHDISEITEKSIEDAKKDIENFVKKTGNLLDGLNEEQIGHDLWLSRCGHGTGYWDRGLGDDGRKLHEIARAMGNKNMFDEVDGIIIE